MSKIKIISVDFQKDFTAKGGICYEPRPSVAFIKEILVPFLRENNIKISEIISDYRSPRPGGRDDCCHPGKRGYESEIPKDIKYENVWVKSMNSHVWTRKNAGLAGKKPGIPYQNPNSFNRWLEKSIGKPKDVDEIVLIGLTIDCCVLCTAQELEWRGYTVKILEEAVDSYSGNQKEKKQILHNQPLENWAKTISWKKLQKKVL